MADFQLKVNELENEMKVLKNEIKAILLDIREQYLQAENPFAGGGRVTIVAPSHASEPANDIASATSNTPPANIASSPSTGIDNDSDIPPDLTSSEIEDKSSHFKKESNKKRGTLPELSQGSSNDDDDDDDNDDTSLRKKGGGKRKGTLPELSQEADDLEENDESPSKISERSKRATHQKDGGRQGYKSFSGNNSGITMITIAGLSKWVDESTEKIGKERTEVMVEASHMVGHISSELKDLLIKLVHLAQTDELKKGKINTKDYLSVIAQLDSLLGYGNESEAALLTILTDSREAHG